MCDNETFKAKNKNIRNKNKQKKHLKLNLISRLRYNNVVQIDTGVSILETGRVCYQILIFKYRYLGESRLTGMLVI